jgi:hypothetical protein
MPTVSDEKPEGFLKSQDFADRHKKTGPKSCFLGI